MKMLFLLGTALWAGACSSAWGPAPTGEATKPRTLRVSVSTPNPCWTIELGEVYVTSGEVMTVSRLEPPPEGRVCVQVIGTAIDQVTVLVPGDRPVRHYVLGRTWSWSGTEGDAAVVFVDDRSALEERLRDAEKVHPE